MAERRHKHRYVDLVCRKCGKECENKKELFQHLEDEHYRHKPPYRCRECSYTSSRSSNLHRHCLLVHTSPKRPSMRKTAPPSSLRLQLPKSNPCAHDKAQSSPKPATSTTPLSPVISLACTPTFEGEALPPARLSGKPLAMLKRTYEVEEDESSEATSDLEEDLTSDPVTHAELPEGPAEVPVALAGETTKAEIPTPSPISSDTILVTVVQKTITRYYSDGLVIRQTDVTNTFAATVPATWNKRVVCNYGMQKD